MGSILCVDTYRYYPYQAFFFHVEKSIKLWQNGDFNAFH